MAVTPDAKLVGRTGHVHTDDPMAFRCDVLQVADHAVIAVRGDVDLATAPALLRRIFDTMTLPISGLTVDLAYVTFLDSSGIHALVQARAVALTRDVAFRLESVPRHVRVVFETCGLSELFGMPHMVEEPKPS
jgi:anti-anti-sigma factor